MGELCKENIEELCKENKKIFKVEGEEMRKQLWNDGLIQNILIVFFIGCLILMKYQCFYDFIWKVENI